MHLMKKKIINSLKSLNKKLTVICVTHKPESFNFKSVKKYSLSKDNKGNTKLNLIK